mgnify:CR=1 FL=1
MTTTTVTERDPGIISSEEQEDPAAVRTTGTAGREAADGTTETATGSMEERNLRKDRGDEYDSVEEEKGRAWDWDGEPRRCRRRQSPHWAALRFP